VSLTRSTSTSASRRRTSSRAGIRERELSPVDVVAGRARADRRGQPSLNCFCFVYPDEAIELARARSARCRAGETRALHGVPIAIKDLTPTKGKRTTMGSYAFEHFVPDGARFSSSVCSARGDHGRKTTTPEFAYSSFTRARFGA
jgi:Asp-tRNA(Asn)/Glu-tRNA(Gln) amidotransferase A subunit family amidase